jgi:hydrophobe/amphiphile efflux-1 (HAE1) family protein
LILYGGLLYLTYTSILEAPKGFIPTQDKGYLLVNLQLPDSSSVARTEQTMRRIEDLVRATPGVKHTVTISGQSMLLGANAPNFGSMYVMLDDFHHRRSPQLSADALAEHLQRTLQAQIIDGLVNVLGAPPLEGLGTTGGFKVMVEDRGNLGLDPLQATADRIVLAAAKTPELRNPFTSFRAHTPWLYLDIDRTEAKVLGVPMSEVFNTLQVYLGSLYVNDFNLFGRTWQVNVQADQHFREQVEDLKHLRVRNQRGQMVPLAAFAAVREVSGPVLIARHNLYAAAPVLCTAAPGVSSGEAIQRLENVVNDGLNWSMRYEWTELALLQLQTGNTAMIALVLAVVLVFLVLAAQYESWALPLAVILVVPMCLLCSITAVLWAAMDVNIFTQVGFVVLVGLACKNAILVVEFARAQREAGKSRYEATLEACNLRLRPIVMTSFAFILGVVPLVVSVGAGAEMRRTLGTAVFGGMLGVTMFGIFLTPVFYYVIEWLSDMRKAVRALRKQPLPAWMPRFSRLKRSGAKASPRQHISAPREPSDVDAS